MRRKSVFLLVGSFLVLFFVAARVFYVSQEPILKAKKEAVALVKDQVQFSKITDFYWFNTSQTYYSIAGSDQNGTPVYVIVSPDTEESLILQQASVVNEDEARSITMQDKQPKKVLAARLGMIDSEPVWEVHYLNQENRNGYYYLSAKSGQWLKDIENL